MTSRQIQFSPEFLENIRKLKRKYPHVEQDVDTLIDLLQMGETPGDRIQGVHPYFVYKVRLSNRDAQRGKSGGYRVIYYVRVSDIVLLVTIYAKSSQTDIPQELIRRIITDFEVNG